MIEYELRITALSIKTYPVSDRDRRCVSKLANITTWRRLEYKRLYDIVAISENKAQTMNELESMMKIVYVQ